jgi:hypothetical protein
MVRPHPSSEPASRSILTWHGDLNSGDDSGVFYIGLGDQFDDDRRLVREITSALRTAIRPSWAEVPVLLFPQNER